MKIGICCYPTYGGSGIVATEIGLGLARRGHEVHFVTTGRPPRLPEGLPRVWHHPVQPREYPVFPQAPYELALTSALVAATRAHGLEILHAHYAVPHATSAWMAREVLGAGAPKVVATLHGTDITLVGADPSYLPVTRHSIQRSDAVTVPSAWLRDETWSRFDLAVPISIVPNFVDPDVFTPGPTERLLVHVSNFRPVKRVDRVVEVFARQPDDVRLLLVGDGPERPAALDALARRGLGGRVEWVGAVTDVAAHVRRGAVFLLTSESESFGVAALEALASGVPVVGTRVGGVPEVVRHGDTGLLGDTVDELAVHTRALLDDEPRRRAMGERARADARARFGVEAVLDRYEAVYRGAISD